MLYVSMTSAKNPTNFNRGSVKKNTMTFQKINPEKNKQRLKKPCWVCKKKFIPRGRYSVMCLSCKEKRMAQRFKKKKYKLILEVSDDKNKDK